MESRWKLSHKILHNSFTENKFWKYTKLYCIRKTLLVDFTKDANPDLAKPRPKINGGVTELRLNNIVK